MILIDICPFETSYVFKTQIGFVGATGEQLAPGAVPQQPVLAAGLAPSAHGLSSLQGHHLNNMVAAIQKMQNPLFQQAQNVTFMQNSPGTTQGTPQLGPLDVAGMFTDRFGAVAVVPASRDSVSVRILQLTYLSSSVA
ncbi:unnamed protein product [Strongylus vulgaris]|uniref:Uncharacterized protein n=1 Tax=Strongylus vulgaris TaxID=40348 RepID=A0A3P7KD76_STRVU|nr:unnamed protein product [Strongylus vulgaris]